MMNKRLYFSIVLATMLSSACQMRSLNDTPNKKIRLCPRLANIKQTPHPQLIIRTKTIDIPSSHAPYNASIVKKGDGFLLIYREDTLTAPSEKKKPMQYDTHLFCVALDKNFDVIGLPKKLELGSSHAEDPRAFFDKNKLYVSYTDLAKNDVARRSIHLATINPDNYSLINQIDIDIGKSQIEKNWTPFLVEGEKEKIFMRYYINPSEVFSITPSSFVADEAKIEMTRCKELSIDWKEMWGKIRGGSPAVMYNGEYLAFFHSSFSEKGKMWYVMGAYTFEKDPPYQITKISKDPILFDGIYETAHKNTAKQGLRAVFPCGIVIEEDQTDPLVHVSLGENDCAVKVLTLNAKALIASLQKVN